MLSFTAATTTGAGRGKGLGTPTINLNLEQIPAALGEGIYACIANDQPAVMHYGPRPVFRDSTTCEVHFLDAEPAKGLASLTVTVVEKIRDVRDFPSPDALKEQIEEDILCTREILENGKW
ncbi:MAG: riboflavin kinase [Candidatus Peribacteraceae bacterium]|nr:riboflavin kinase [Candidatus Peribacteraceae bacterium]